MAQVSGLDRPRPVPVVDESGGPGVDEAGALAGRVADVSREGRPSAAKVLLGLKAARGAVGADIGVRESSSRPVSATAALYESLRGKSGAGSEAVAVEHAGMSGADRSGPRGAVEAVPDVTGADRADADTAVTETGAVGSAVPAENASDEQVVVDGGGRTDRRAEKRFVPVEGPDNIPADPVESRPRVGWRAGDRVLDPGDLTYRDPVVYVWRAGDASDHAGAKRPPGSGLGSTVAWPDPSHSPAERQERAAAGRAVAAEVVDGRNWSNAKYAGETYTDWDDDDLRDKYPNGVRFSYDGFPIFEDYACKTVQFDDWFAPRRANGEPDRYADEKRANAIFGWSRTPEDMTWHHKEDGRTLILMSLDLHADVRHWGGERVIKVSEQREAELRACRK